MSLSIKKINFLPIKPKDLCGSTGKRALNSHIDSSLILKQNLLSTPDLTDYPYEELEITASVAETFWQKLPTFPFFSL